MKKMKSVSEEELLQRAICGEGKALNELIGLYPVFIKKEIRFRYKKIESTDVDDICQSVCCAIYKNITEGRYQIGTNFRAYVRSITINKTFDFMRKQYHKKPLVIYSLDDIPSSAVAEEESVYGLTMDAEDNIDGCIFDEEIISGDTIRLLLSSIPCSQSLVIELRFFQDMKFRQIANMLGLPFSTVVARFRYGIKKLKKVAESMHLRE